MSNQKLEAKVKAVNTAHSAAMNLYPVLRKALEPFVGTKVRKADQRTLMQKVDNAVREAMKDFVAPEGVDVFSSGSMYNLAWTVRARDGSGEVWMYHETTVYIAELAYDRVTMTKLCDAIMSVRRDDYTAEEISRLRQEYEAAKKIADEAKSKLGEFGEYDR